MTPLWLPTVGTAEVVALLLAGAAGIVWAGLVLMVLFVLVSALVLRK